MIETGWHTKSAVDAGVIFGRHARNPLRLQKGNKLVAPRIEEHVPQASAFFDLYGVGDYGLESQHLLVKLAGLVEVKGGKTDVGKSFVTHGYNSFCKPLTRDPFIAYSSGWLTFLKTSPVEERAPGQEEPP